MTPHLSNGVLVFLGLGSNLGDRVGHLRAGIRYLLDHAEIALHAVSSLFESHPVACEGGPFLNAVVAVRTALGPEALLRLLKAAEREAGRTGSRGDARPLDMDILFYGHLVLQTPTLTIPHSAVFERPFVLAPLLEVCGDVLNPRTGERIRDDAESALTRLDIRPRLVAGPGWWEGAC